VCEDGIGVWKQSSARDLRDEVLQKLAIFSILQCCIVKESGTTYGSDTLESFLSNIAFESNLRKKLSRIEHVLIVKVSFEKNCESFHDTRASFLLKVTFESDFRKKTF